MPTKYATLPILTYDMLPHYLEKVKWSNVMHI